ncbi:MAG: MBL fold metallo-hydrolase [Solirubrobacteraceae bacterium]
MLTQVADGVWVRQSAWVWTNSIAVRGEDGLILVDPGIDGSDLNQLADDLDRLGTPVVAGFSTHPHWDHLLWHPGSATCPATPPPPAPTLPVKPDSGRRRWRRKARRASLSS